jgi:hypothetical protein
MMRRAIPAFSLFVVVVACQQPGEKPGRRVDDGTATNAQRREAPEEMPMADEDRAARQELPGAQPQMQPGAQPETKPGAPEMQPGAQPQTRPGAQPGMQPGAQPGGAMPPDASARFEERANESPSAFATRAKEALAQIDGELLALERQLGSTPVEPDTSAPVTKAREAAEAAKKRTDEAGTEADAQSRAAVVAAINRARQSLLEAKRKLEAERTM